MILNGKKTPRWSTTVKVVDGPWGSVARRSGAQAGCFETGARPWCTLDPRTAGGLPISWDPLGEGFGNWQNRPSWSPFEAERLTSHICGPKS